MGLYLSSYAEYCDLSFGFAGTALLRGVEQLNTEIAKKNSEAAQQASLAAQKILDEAEAEKAHILAAAQQAAEQAKARISSN